LLAGAGALAGGLSSSLEDAALAASPPPGRVFERRLGPIGPAALTLALTPGADLIGLECQSAAHAGLELRLQGGGGRWSRWVSAAGCAPAPADEGGAGVGDGTIGAPVWSAGARVLQLRAARRIADVRLHTVDVSAGSGARRLARGLFGTASAFTSGPLPALGAGQPPILPRKSWGQGMARPRVAPGYGAVRMAFVHHTQTPNGYLAGEVPAMLRAIFLYHRDVRGWNDIGYNFVIDAFGRIFEARAGGIDEPVIGAHAGGFNLVSTGVAVLGAFSSEQVSPAAARALEALLAWKLSLHGVAPRGRARVRVNPAGAPYSRFAPGAHVWLAHISGHRDGDTTDCPGDLLYGKLPALREGVLALAPLAGRASLALGPAATPAGPLPAGVAPALTGSLTRLDGSPLAGAPVELQLRRVSARGLQVSERTLARVVTDAAGNFSLQAGPLGPSRGGGWLRALYRGGQGELARAALSDPMFAGAGVIRSLEALSPTQAASAPPVP
jgi:hypothetical protein